METISSLPPQIYLVPKSLARKRIWNKKYPICIELGRQEDFMAKAQPDKEPSEEKLPAEKELGGEDPKKPAHPQEGTTPRAGQRDQILYLFGRTGREKEEWFQRFILASKLKSEPKKPSGVSGAKPGNEWMVCQTHLWFKVLEASETCPGEREGRRAGMKKVKKKKETYQF